MATPTDKTKNELSFFHALSKSITNESQYVFESKYKSAHSVKASEVWADEIQYCIDVTAADLEATNNPAVTKHTQVPLTEVPGSNGQAWYLDVMNSFVRPWISPVDVPQIGTNDSSDGYQVNIYTEAGVLISPTAGVWMPDYYAGLIHFGNGFTPNDSGYGIPKITVYAYSGSYGAGGGSATADTIPYIKYIWNTKAELVLQLGMTKDEQGLHKETGWVWRFDGAVWVKQYKSYRAYIESETDPLLDSGVNADIDIGDEWYEPVSKKLFKRIHVDADDMWVEINKDTVLEVSQLAGASEDAVMSQKAITDLVDTKVSKVVGKDLSTNDYTDDEKLKLSKLESSRFKGQYTSLEQLQTNVLTPNAGDYANVDEGLSLGVNRYIWDSVLVSWKKEIGASTEMTAAQVKEEYESNLDTNAFTDLEKAKLLKVKTLYTWSNQIERLAQVDMLVNDTGLQIDTKWVWKYDGTSWAKSHKTGTLYIESLTDPKLDPTINTDITVGDEWFALDSGTLLKRISDGTNEAWLDVTGSVIRGVAKSGSNSSTTPGGNLELLPGPDTRMYGGTTEIISSNVVVTDRDMVFAGTVNTPELISGSETIIPVNGWSEGVNYLYKEKGGVWKSTPVEPSFERVKPNRPTFVKGKWQVFGFSTDGSLNTSMESATAIMTSPTTPSGEVTFSTRWDYTYDGYKAFNGITKTDDSWATGAGVVTGWIAYKFPTPKVINKYTIELRVSVSIAEAPKKWTLEGSNTGLFTGEQTILDTRVNETVWTLAEPRIFAFVNGQEYLHYRLNITENNGQGYICIAEIKLIEAQADSVGIPILPTITYLNKKVVVASNVPTSVSNFDYILTGVGRVPDYYVLYPEGSSDNPYIMGVNKRIVVDNPYGAKQVTCQAQILKNGNWGDPGWIYASGGIGIKASCHGVDGEEIVIQSGNGAVCSQNYNTGSPLLDSTQDATAKMRVVIWRR